MRSLSSHLITATNGAGVTEPLAVAGYRTARASRNIIHDLLDGSIGVSFIPPRPRADTLVTVYTDRAAAFAAYALYAEPTTFIYQSADLPNLDMTFVLDSRLEIEQDNAQVGVWYVHVGYQEVTG